MPTIKPLPGQNGGDGEGQLKPITASHRTPAPAPAATQQPQPAPAQPQAQPRPAAAPQPRPGAPAQPPAATQRLKPKIGTGPRINRMPDHGATAQSAESVSATAQQQLRDSAYTDQALQSLWDAYIAAHPQEVILVNTMRASRPRRKADGAADEFIVTVENEAQQAKMTEALPEIIMSLRNGLANDSIGLSIEVNHGEGGSHTWNEREVLAHMLENNPALQGFIDEFKLNLG